MDNNYAFVGGGRWGYTPNTEDFGHVNGATFLGPVSPSGVFRMKEQNPAKVEFKVIAIWETQQTMHWGDFLRKKTGFVNVICALSTVVEVQKAPNKEISILFDEGYEASLDFNSTLKSRLAFHAPSRVPFCLHACFLSPPSHHHRPSRALSVVAISRPLSSLLSGPLIAATLALVAPTARPLSSSPLAPCYRHRSVNCMVHAAAGTEGRYAWTFDGVTVARTSLLRPVRRLPSPLATAAVAAAPPWLLLPRPRCRDPDAVAPALTPPLSRCRRRRPDGVASAAALPSLLLPRRRRYCPVVAAASPPSLLLP
ncbi:hypothetical protein BGW80DRAFT_1556266 [Lactifluus volemus]|nr:hypothetical protein BGW80DRAFT_1556266 [Lactifluus volemus]